MSIAEQENPFCQACFCSFNAQIDDIKRWRSRTNKRLTTRWSLVGCCCSDNALKGNLCLYMKRPMGKWNSIKEKLSRQQERTVQTSFSFSKNVRDSGPWEETTTTTKATYSNKSKTIKTKNNNKTKKMNSVYHFHFNSKFVYLYGVIFSFFPPCISM